MIARRTSMGMTDQSQGPNAHNLPGPQACRSNSNVITDFNSTQKMIKVEHQEKHKWCHHRLFHS